VEGSAEAGKSVLEPERAVDRDEQVVVDPVFVVT